MVRRRFASDRMRGHNWSARMYPAFVGVATPGLNGMRCALVLFSYAAFAAFSGCRFRGRRDRPFCHLMVSPANLAGIFQTQTAVVGLQMWESRSDFQAWGC